MEDGKWRMVNLSIIGKLQASKVITNQTGWGNDPLTGEELTNTSLRRRLLQLGHIGPRAPPCRGP